MRVSVYFLKGKGAPASELEAMETIQRWMLENLYDHVWEAEFKNLITPEVLAVRFHIDEEPFGIPLRKRNLSRRDLRAGDIIQIGPTFHLVLPGSYRILQVSTRRQP